LDFDNLLTRPGAGILLRPWFDRVTLSWMVRLYFPLSRAWAAGLAAADDVAAFAAEVPLRDVPAGAVRPALSLLARRSRDLAVAEEAWSEAAFGDVSRGGEALERAERRRRAVAQAWMLSRGAFLPLLTVRRPPAVRWAIAGPERVAARHGARLAGTEAAFPVPEVPPVAESCSFRGRCGDVSWLRFESPSRIGDTAWAQVYSPYGARQPPTLIFLHGVAMESEFFVETSDPVNALAEDGIRVVRPEAPWHGRRRLRSYYGGEPIFAWGPMALIDLLQAWLAELVVLIAWARATSTGPVAVGGLSLGALASQLAATAACTWPAALRPDVLFLAATSGDLMAVTMTGSLPAGLGLPERLRKAGWTRSGIARWLPLVAPGDEPAVDPQHIVMLLGRRDDVTPFRGGRALAERWGVPRQNRFENGRGHFTVLMGLNRDRSPLSRLQAVLQGATARSDI
jgi:pimeloyl-ACP methyl ester carboxylesterase